MIKDFEELRAAAAKRGPIRIAVANAHDSAVLKSVKEAHDLGIAEGILVGKKAEIEEIAAKIGLSLKAFEIIDEQDPVKACEHAVRAASEGRASAVMKGLVDTAVIMKAVLNKEWGLRTGKTLSQASVMKSPYYHKLIIMTDPAINIYPDVATKKKIIENVLSMARAIGIEKPNVACVCSKESVTDKMIATVDAAELVRMNKEGELAGCTVGGPFGLDNALSVHAAEVKGIKDPMCGDVDVLLMPSVDCGNIFYKALVYLSKIEIGGLVLGAKVPIIMTSRSDSDIFKLNSIALAALMKEVK